MASETPIRVAIIGLGFGAEFIPIYQSYQGAEMSAICRRDQKGLDEGVGRNTGSRAVTPIIGSSSKIRRSTPFI